MNDNEIMEVGKTVAKRGRPKGSKDSYQRAGRADLSKMGTATPEQMSAYIRHARDNANLPSIDISDVEQVKERIEWYLDHCEADGMKPTVTGLCNALGVDKSTVYRWEHGQLRPGTHQDVIVKYKKLLEELWEMEMVEGKINPIVGIFLGKNHFGYQDKQDIILTPNNPLGEDVSTDDELKEKYLESVAFDDTDVIEVGEIGITLPDE